MLSSVFNAFLALFALAVFAVAFGRRLAVGYPAAPSGLAVLHRGEVALIQSAAEVLFPDAVLLPIAGVEARLPCYVDRHLSALPTAQRLQIRALLLAFEHLPFLVPAPGPGGRDRFSSQGPTARLAVLERVANHPTQGFRLLFAALRAVLALGYLGHPENLQALGLAPFELENGVSDAELLFPRIGALPMTIRFGEADRTRPEALGPLDPHGPRHPAHPGARRDPR